MKREQKQIPSEDEILEELQRYPEIGSSLIRLALMEQPKSSVSSDHFDRLHDLGCVTKMRQGRPGFSATTGVGPLGKRVAERLQIRRTGHGEDRLEDVARMLLEWLETQRDQRGWYKDFLHGAPKPTSFDQEVTERELLDVMECLHSCKLIKSDMCFDDFDEDLFNEVISTGAGRRALASPERIIRISEGATMKSVSTYHDNSDNRKFVTNAEGANVVTAIQGDRNTVTTTWNIADVDKDGAAQALRDLLNDSTVRHSNIAELLETSLDELELPTPNRDTVRNSLMIALGTSLINALVTSGGESVVDIITNVMSGLGLS